MKRVICLLFILTMLLDLQAQIKEPDFVGEAYLIVSENSFKQLDREIGNFMERMSFKTNGLTSFVFVEGKSAKTRIKASDIDLIVKAVDNESDPLSIIGIFRFDVKRNKRVLALSVARASYGRTFSKNQIKFRGKKYGKSSYLISLRGLKPGEYGIIVSNPKNQDEKRTIVSCFNITE